MQDANFHTLILSFWRRHGRCDLPWRKTEDPYKILVSEVMLQQTQVARVIPKYEEFVAKFPTFRALARARVQEVLRCWQGLGYNRRALMLHRCAQTIVREHAGKLPDHFETLRTLPGIGPYTAGAVLVFAFNQPRAIIETNIRRVYLHHYFPHEKKVSDALLMPIIERTMDRKNPRQWFSALMDYGSWLATEIENPNIRSTQYTRQSKFEGSLRQLRGRVLRAIVQQNDVPKELQNDTRFPVVLAQLKREGFMV